MNSKLQEALDDCNRYMAQMHDAPKFDVVPNVQDGGFIIYASENDSPISTRLMVTSTLEGTIEVLRAIPPIYIVGWADGFKAKKG